MLLGAPDTSVRNNSGQAWSGEMGRMTSGTVACRPLRPESSDHRAHAPQHVTSAAATKATQTKTAVRVPGPRHVQGAQSNLSDSGKEETKMLLVTVGTCRPASVSVSTGNHSPALPRGPTVSARFTSHALLQVPHSNMVSGGPAAASPKIPELYSGQLG